MSPEEVIRTAYDAVNRGDLEALLGLMDAAVRIRSVAVRAPRGEWFEGYVGARDWWHAMLATYDRFRFELLSLEVDGERAVAELRAWFVVGGRTIETGGWQSARLRGPRIVMWGRYDTEAEARASVGMAMPP
jgi:ketosteroid isomerase-like protein